MDCLYNTNQEHHASILAVQAQIAAGGVRVSLYARYIIVKRERRNQTRVGFTIVELLIVVVVIAILAAITIVAYNGIQNRAKASAAQSAASQAAKKVALWQVDNPGQSPDQNTFNDLVGSTGAANYQYTAGANGAFCITATANNVSYFTSGGSPVAGGCDGHGQNGRLAITNLVINPSVETNANFYGLNAGNGGGVATGARVATGGLYGSAFYRETWTTAPTAAGSTYIQSSGAGTNDATAGKTYFFRASARTSWAATLKLTIVWWNASNATISSASSANYTMTPNQWTTLSTSATAATGTVRIRYIIESVGAFPLVNSTLDVDGLLIAEGDGPYEYADGTSPNWLWTNTAHGSTSYGPQL
jgi:prepilin-type N-terminal cleavage/methylation domain-containing protein